MIKEKICPYCSKSIAGNYSNIDEDLKCPKCKTMIPKMYLKYPNRHVISLSAKENLSDYPKELELYLKNSIVEGRYSRAECYVNEDYPNIRLVLFEYLVDDYSFKRQIEVIVFHSFDYSENGSLPKADLMNASDIILNLDITDLPALYFNVGISRDENFIESWVPSQSKNLVREVLDYLTNNNMAHKVAIAFGNMSYLSNSNYFKTNEEYKKLLRGHHGWKSDYDDRMWIKDANNTIIRFLREIGEERLVEDVLLLPASCFFLYSDSKHRMTSHMFWMMSIMLWICRKLD
jgi:hypothetical protein